LKSDPAAKKLTFGEKGKTPATVIYKNKPVDLKVK